MFRILRGRKSDIIICHHSACTQHVDSVCVLNICPPPGLSHTEFRRSSTRRAAAGVATETELRLQHHSPHPAAAAEHTGRLPGLRLTQAHTHAHTHWPLFSPCEADFKCMSKESRQTSAACTGASCHMFTCSEGENHLSLGLRGHPVHPSVCSIDLLLCVHVCVQRGASQSQVLALA